MATINTIMKPLSIEPNGIPTVISLSQNENGRAIVFELLDTIPDGSTVLLTGTKPDETVYSLDGVLSGNVATFDEDIQMTAVAGEWDAKVKIINGGDTVATGRVRFIIDPDTTDGSTPSDSQLDGLVAQAQAYAEAASEYAYGAPLAALTAADMTDYDQVYIYVGSETGYTAGDWYYWSGSAWVSGGTYGAGTINVDTTISTSSHNPVENRAIGQALYVKIGYPARAGGVDYGTNGQVLSATGDSSRVKWITPQFEPEHADSDTYGTIKLQRYGDPAYGLQMKVTYDNDNVDYFPRLYNNRISYSLLPSATDVSPGAVILDRTVTTQDKAADAKAVRDLIGDLSNLDTTDKSNLVGAINEAAQSGGGGGGGGGGIPEPAIAGTEGQVLTSDSNGDASWEDLPVTAWDTYGTLKMTFNGDAPGGYVRLTGNVGNNKTEMALDVPRIESGGTIRNKYIPAANSSDYGGVKASYSPGVFAITYENNGSEVTQNLPYLNNSGKISTTVMPTATTSTQGAVILDTTLAETGQAADAKAVGDAIAAIGGGGGGASAWESIVSPTTPSTSVSSYSQSFGDYKELFCAYNISSTDGATNISTQLGIGTKTARVANNIREYAGYSGYKRFIVFVHAVKTDDNSVVYQFTTLRSTSSNTGITTNNMTLPSYDYYSMGVVALESDLIAFYDNNTTDTNKTYTFAAWGR